MPLSRIVCLVTTTLGKRLKGIVAPYPNALNTSVSKPSNSLHLCRTDSNPECGINVCVRQFPENTLTYLAGGIVVIAITHSNIVRVPIDCCHSITARVCNSASESASLITLQYL